MHRSILSIRERLSPIYQQPEIESLIAIIFDHVCGYSKTEMIMHRNQLLSATEADQINLIVSRLLRQEPIQYILGEAHFYGLKLWVNPSVLIPRSETEELVDLIVRSTKMSCPKIFDLGTGSGCIAIALQKNISGSEVWACDLSNEALAVAANNAKQHYADVQFFECDILSGLNCVDLPMFDVLVSNPPYVLQREKQIMNKNVTEYEPHKALFVSDDDPLVFYRAISRIGMQMLTVGGKVYFEINEAYGGAMIELMGEAGYKEVILHQDLQGKDRIIEAQKK